MHCLCCVFIFTNVVQTVPRTDLTSYSLGAVVLFPVVSSPGVERTIRVQPVPRLRISAAVLVLQTRPCLEYRGTMSLYLRVATVFAVC